MGFHSFGSALFVPIGAFVCWLFKGFKGGYFDQDTDENEQKNKWIGMLSLCVVVIAVEIARNL